MNLRRLAMASCIAVSMFAMLTNSASAAPSRQGLLKHERHEANVKRSHLLKHERREANHKRNHLLKRERHHANVERGH